MLTTVDKVIISILNHKEVKPKDLIHNLVHLDFSDLEIRERLWHLSDRGILRFTSDQFFTLNKEVNSLSKELLI